MWAFWCECCLESFCQWRRFVEEFPRWNRNQPKSWNNAGCLTCHNWFHLSWIVVFKAQLHEARVISQPSNIIVQDSLLRKLEMWMRTTTTKEIKLEKIYIFWATFTIDPSVDSSYLLNSWIFLDHNQNWHSTHCLQFLFSKRTTSRRP